MTNKKRSLFFILIFLIPVQVLFAYDRADFQKYKSKYPNQRAVVLNHKQDVTISVDDESGELLIYETDYEEVLYLQESAKFYTTQNIYTSDFFEDIMSVSAVVYSNEGKKYKLKPENFRIVDSPPSSWVFHDDDKELIFDLKELGEGYRTVISYTKRIKRPEFFETFHFMSVYKTENSEINITFPKDVEMTFFEQNLEKSEVKRNEEELKKGNKKMTWLLSDVARYKVEEGSTNIKNHIPHLIAQINSYQVEGKKKELIGSSDDLHRFFSEFLLLKDEGDGNKSKSEMKRIADEITAGMTESEEMMDTIFRWVQANIKYIAFEDGINGYVPRACSEVMGNRYGDCKDMGNLLVEMLDYKEVGGAYVAWVGTREIPYQMSEIPSPLTCNHVICVVNKPEGGYYYLDATHAEGGYLLPPENIQNKELLIHKGLGDYELYKVPPAPADNNYLKSVIRYYLDEDDSIRGSGVDLYGGYERENRTYYLSNLDQTDLDEYVKDLSLGGVNRFRLNDYSIDNLSDKNKALKISYDFAADNLFIADGEELILNPTLFKPRVTQYNTEDHRLPRFKKHHRTVDYEFQFTIPNGYKLKQLPENVNYNHDLFSFSGTFKLEENTVKVNMLYQYHLLEIAPELYEDWNQFSKSINRASIQNIVLQKL